MTEILGICGSARKKGNTTSLINDVLESSGMESELIFLSDLKVGFCTGCLQCRENKGTCPKDDDMHLAIKLACEKRASTWVTARPMHSHETVLHKGDFRNAMRLRYA